MDHHNRTTATTTTTTAAADRLGPRGLIKRHEFLRLIAQSLRSLGYHNSASSLELESGVSILSPQLSLLQTLLSSSLFDSAISSLLQLHDLPFESCSDALLLVLKRKLLNYLTSNDIESSLYLLRKEVRVLGLGDDSLHELAVDLVRGRVEDEVAAVEEVLAAPVMVPERRLERLVEMVVARQVETCVYHNCEEAVSLYVDHECGRDRIPTETVQVLDDHENEVWFV